jgi:hypothetical protein
LAVSYISTELIVSASLGAAGSGTCSGTFRGIAVILWDDSLTGVTDDEVGRAIPEGGVTSIVEFSAGFVSGDPLSFAL